MQREIPAPCDFRVETHRRAHRPLSALRVVSMLTLFCALSRKAMAAPEVFTASGTFESGQYSQLSGTVTIDTVTFPKNDGRREVIS
jgi:hypothetical protein